MSTMKGGTLPKGWALRRDILKYFGSITAFGRAVGRSHTHVCNVLQGHRHLKPDEQQKWMKALAARTIDSLPKEAA